MRAVACFFAPNVFLRHTCSLIGVTLNMNRCIVLQARWGSSLNHHLPQSAA
ncbi:unnamed protein product [Chondrus crispus]|uniref:Uncharacterized protein n=2 Tax=Chondrus crispus TaxID=2769 RepID=R7QB41_CHOCR|nr:unnamed protein product [Chondrus crispus]CDF34685.1 unnamed protein product [Chondrus crispus]|eukprot:XP_005714504.1 unnamed protein product [Chondrus crispus]